MAGGAVPYNRSSHSQMPFLEVFVPALPYPVARIIDAALVGELTVVGPDGRPITYPMVPILWSERIYMTSSALDSTKIGHIKANPRVTFSVTNPQALGAMPGRATVECDARVAEEDLHVGWEDLIVEWRRKDPLTVGLLKARLAFPLIFERTLIELTPRRTWLWPDGRTDHEPIATVAAEVAR